MKRLYFVVFAVPTLFGQTLTTTDVQKMLAAQVPQDVIAAKVKQTGKAFSLTTDEIIGLRKAGASDALLSLLVGSAPSNQARLDPPEITIPDGTEVKLLLKNPLSSATAQPEQRIEFSASDDVVVHGVTVIAKGAPGVGHVTEVQARKSFGRKGKLLFSIDAVQAVSGDNIRLRSTKTASGADNYGTAGVVTILAGPLGALVRGKDVDVAAGTEFTIYIDGEPKIAARPAPASGGEEK